VQGSIPRPDRATLTRNVGLSRRRRATQIVRADYSNCALVFWKSANGPPSLVAHPTAPTLQRRRIITTYASLQKTPALRVRARYRALSLLKALASRRANRDVFHVLLGQHSAVSCDQSIVLWVGNRYSKKRWTLERDCVQESRSTCYEQTDYMLSTT
jgi:hypothetical protein